ILLLPATHSREHSERNRRIPALKHSARTKRWKKRTAPRTAAETHEVFEQTVSSSTCRRHRRLEHGANNFRRQSSGFGLERSHCRFLVIFNCSASFLDLGLRLPASFGHRIGAYLCRLSPARLLRLEQCETCLPEALLVFRRAGFGRRHVSFSLLDRALRSPMTLGQNPRQRLVHNKGVKAVKQQKENDGRDGTEQ